MSLFVGLFIKILTVLTHPSYHGGISKWWPHVHVFVALDTGDDSCTIIVTYLTKKKIQLKTVTLHADVLSSIIKCWT